jgi:2-succinyl-5-enolpyruvyl-6-hydroxy-3-cyclohexene-1-carboxylate synthase
LRIVVADDAGGSIFATLEYGAPEFADAFERVFATPSGLDVAAVVAGYGVPVRRLSSISEVAAALAEPVIGLEVLVVDVDRTRRREVDRRV